MTTAEESNVTLEVDEFEEFISDEELNDDEEVHGDNVTQAPINWTTEITPPMLLKFDNSISGMAPSIDLDSTSTELQFFEYFCNHDLLKKIANCTNEYHQHFERNTDLKSNSRLQRWQDVTFEDLYVLLALTMLFTRNKRQTIEEHWSTNPLLHSTVFHNTMSRNRYCSILSMLSFYEESSDTSDVPRLHKIKMLVDHARETFKGAFVPGQTLCISENVVPFKGNLVIKQCSNKRNRFGIKLFVLCDIETGYIVDFIVYCGSRKEMGIETVPNIGISGSIVSELLKDYFFFNRVLYVDYRHSSPQLFIHLKERATYACGTVRPNRRGMPQFGKLKRGEKAAYMSPPLLALKWQDREPVFMLSTKHDDRIVPSDSVDHASGSPEMKPQCVVDYTKNMKSVDIAEMMTSSFDCIKKSKKWHVKLGFHIFDMFLLNAFYLFKTFKANKKANFADFQLKVIRQIIEKYKKCSLTQHSTPRGIKDPNRVLHDNALEHFPVRIPSGKSQRCKMCAAKKQRTCTRFMCRKCKVYLCVDPCAVEYHNSTKQNKIEEFEHNKVVRIKEEKKSKLTECKN